MKNDDKILETIKKIAEVSKTYVTTVEELGNHDAYSDRILEEIIELAKVAEVYSEDNMNFEVYSRFVKNLQEAADMHDYCLSKEEASKICREYANEIAGWSFVDYNDVICDYIAEQVA